MYLPLHLCSFLWLQKSYISSVENLGNPEKDEVENKISYSITRIQVLSYHFLCFYPSLHSAPPNPLHPPLAPALHLRPPAPNYLRFSAEHLLLALAPNSSLAFFFKAVKKIVNNRVCKMDMYSLNNDVMNVRGTTTQPEYFEALDHIPS